MKLIIACDPKGGIGYKNKLPWDKIEGDLPRFKRLTKGSNVVMGRKTWESLPSKPLPERRNIIVSKRGMPAHPGVAVISDIKLIPLNSWIIGGAELIANCFHLIREVHLTRVNKVYECDCRIDLSYLVQNFELVYDYPDEYPDHSYQIWKRI